MSCNTSHTTLRASAKRARALLAPTATTSPTARIQDQIESGALARVAEEESEAAALSSTLQILGPRRNRIMYGRNMRVRAAIGGRHVAAMLVLVSAVVCLLLSPAIASAGETTDPPADQLPGSVATPKVSIIPTTTQAFVLVPGYGPGLLADGHEIGPVHAVIRPVLSNSGDETRSLAISASLHQNRGECSGSKVSVARTTENEFVLGKNEARAEELRLTLPAGCAGLEGTLMVMAGGAPATMAFTVRQDFSQRELWAPVVTSAGAFAIYLLAVLFLLWRQDSLSNDVPAGVAWSFKDSWLTNLATVGGLLLTVLSASELVSLVLPGRDTARLTGLNLLFTAFVTAAPIVYAATSRWYYDSKSDAVNPPLASKGRAWGGALAAGLTVAGVVGQLGTIALMAWAAARTPAGPRYFIVALCFAASVGVLLYGLVFITKISRPGPEASQPSQPRGAAAFFPQAGSGSARLPAVAERGGRTRSEVSATL